MKKLISIILICSVFSATAFADCDFSKGITKLPDGNYEYTKECHIKVGELVQQNQVQAQQIQDYQKAIDLKNLAIKYDDERVALWQKSSNDELDRATKIESNQKHNEILYFALGVATTFLAGYTAAKLAGR